MRTCAECRREFEPSSGHLRCPKCRHPDQQVDCACGRRMNRESVQCAACRSEAGPNNSNWRGGRSYSKAGYVMVRVVGHPRAAGSASYVFEHILVMEELLGRYLVPGENVHHKNGVKHDNRPENLELWTRPQPSGARVEDLVVWAREIIARYGDLVP